MYLNNKWKRKENVIKKMKVRILELERGKQDRQEERRLHWGSVEQAEAERQKSL